MNNTEEKKNLFSGNKNVKKGSDSTQKFRDSLSGFQFGSAKGDNSKNFNENNKRNLNVMDTMAPSKKLKASEEKAIFMFKQKQPNPTLELQQEQEQQKLPIAKEEELIYETTPIEFAMYQSVRYQSNENLMWCSEENIANIASESLNSFLTQRPLQYSNLTKDEMNYIAVDRSLYYYTYPESSLENYYIELVRETSKNSEESNVTKISPNDVEILNSWKAKRSNWYLVNNFLYLIVHGIQAKGPKSTSTKGPKSASTKDNTQLLGNQVFLHYFAHSWITRKDVAGLSHPVVIMNTSTRRMRDSMDNFYRCISGTIKIRCSDNFSDILYKMPFLKTISQADIVSTEDTKSLLEVENKIPDQVILSNKIEYAIDYQVESLLVFEGIQEIQKLFNFLTVYYDEQPEVFIPTLYSKYAFLYSTLRKLELTTKKMLTNTLSTAYTIKLNGPIFPDVVNSLCSIFEETQTSFFVKLRSNSNNQFGKTLKLLLNNQDTNEELAMKGDKNTEKDRNIERYREDSLYSSPLLGTALLSTRLDWERRSDGKGIYLLNKKD